MSMKLRTSLGDLGTTASATLGLLHLLSVLNIGFGPTWMAESVGVRPQRVYEANIQQHLQAHSKAWHGKHSIFWQMLRSMHM